MAWSDPHSQANLTPSSAAGHNARPTTSPAGRVDPRFRRNPGHGLETAPARQNSGPSHPGLRRRTTITDSRACPPPPPPGRVHSTSEPFCYYLTRHHGRSTQARGAPRDSAAARTALTWWSARPRFWGRGASPRAADRDQHCNLDPISRRRGAEPGRSRPARARKH
jgi:hypothetical protein